MVRSNKWLVLGHHFSNVLVFMHFSFNWCVLLYPNGLLVFKRGEALIY